MPQARSFTAVRFLLEIAIIPVALVSFYALFVGLTFGFRLWRLDAPLVTILWLIVVLAPAWFYGLLKWSQYSRLKTLVVFGGVAAILSWIALRATS